MGMRSSLYDLQILGYPFVTRVKTMNFLFQLYQMIIKKILSEDTDIINIDTISNEKISQQKLAKVFINGDWIGCWP